MVLNRYTGLPHPEAIKAWEESVFKISEEQVVFLQLALFV